MSQSSMDLDSMVQDRFADVCIEKSLARQAGLGDRALPAYVIDWLISRYSDGQHIDRERIKQFIALHLPDKAHKNILLNDVVNGATMKILDAYSVSVDIKNGLKKLRIPCLDIF